MKELTIERDDNAQTVTIEGITYSQELFRQLGGLMPVGQSFRLVTRSIGAYGNTLTIETIEAPAVERQESNYYEKIGNAISDILDGRTLTAIAALRTIQAWESTPKPLMVTFADHKKGLDAYLEQITALQSTIARLEARITQLESEAEFAAATYQAARDRIAELESGGREPVAWMYLERSEDGYEYRPLFSPTKWLVLPDGFYEEIELYAAPAAPVAAPSDLLQRLAYALSQVGKADHLVDYDAVILAREGLRAYLDATAALNGDK